MDEFLEIARKGDEFIYHTGHLAEVRFLAIRGFASRKGPVVDPEIDDLAKEAWRAMELKLVYLTQRRVGDEFQYLAVRT